MEEQHCKYNIISLRMVSAELPLFSCQYMSPWCFDHFEFGPRRASISILQLKLLTHVKQDLVKSTLFQGSTQVFKPCTAKVRLCRAVPEFVWGLFLSFPGLPKAGPLLRGIRDNNSGPFCRSWVAAVVHCSCIACCGSNCAMFLQCSTEALSASAAQVESPKSKQDSEQC